MSTDWNDIRPVWGPAADAKGERDTRQMVDAIVAALTERAEKAEAEVMRAKTACYTLAKIYDSGEDTWPDWFTSVGADAVVESLWPPESE